MNTQHSDLVRQLAAFRLSVKRSFRINIDLEALVNDADYARQCLSDIEELADTEELLVTVMQLRQRLVPQRIQPEVAATPEPERKITRDYKFGARSW